MKKGAEIKNCLFMAAGNDQDAMLSITEDGLYIKMHDYALIPKSEYKELIDTKSSFIDTKSSFPVVLSSSIIFLVAAFIFYLVTQ